TAIRGLCYSYLFIKRLPNSNRRIMMSDQRGGRNFPEIAIGFDNVTGRLVAQGTMLEAEIDEAKPQVLAALEDTGEHTEPEIRNALPIRGWVVGRALRELVKKGDVERVGAGKRGNPFRYSLAATIMDETETPVTPSRDTSPYSYSYRGEN